MKALALFSGGLDSILAVKLVESQGIEVIALNFSSPFFSSKNAVESAKANNINLKVIALGMDYLEMLRKPKYGFGIAMNPCISCKILMLKKARQIMEDEGAKFIITGFVLGQRPMSQHMKALRDIENESGCAGILLNPLSAKLLRETLPEKKGWVDRNNLMDIQGRGRKKQISLAKKLKLIEYPSPAGGCLLCDVSFGKKLRDLFERKKEIVEEDIELLKCGRHFRIGESRIIVGRNEKENANLMRLRAKSDYVFEVKGFGSPITLLRGKKSVQSVKTAAELTARYSNAPNGNVVVDYEGRKITVAKPLGYSEKEMAV